jgi:hypothetical protein
MRIDCFCLTATDAGGDRLFGGGDTRRRAFDGCGAGVGFLQGMDRGDDFGCGRRGRFRGLISGRWRVGIRLGGECVFELGAEFTELLEIIVLLEGADQVALVIRQLCTGKCQSLLRTGDFTGVAVTQSLQGIENGPRPMMIAPEPFVTARVTLQVDLRRELGMQCRAELQPTVSAERLALVLGRLHRQGFDFGGLPRGIQVMQGDEEFLHVGAGAQLARAAEDHSDGTVADTFKDSLLLGITVGLADTGDLRFRDT